jgi:hypothetical protein
MKRFFLKTFLIEFISVMILLIAGDKSTAQDRQALESSFSARRQEVLQYFVQQAPHPEEEFAGIAARCAAQEKLPEAIALYSRQLRSPKNNLTFQFSLMAAYAYGAKSFPDSMKSLAQRRFSINPMLRGRGELDWHLYYSTIFLASQFWPQATGWFNGKSSEENHREAGEYLMQWMQSIATRGQKEFDSPEHLPSFLMTLFVLYDFADDPQFRHRARMVLDLLLADFAAEHLAGQYAGAHAYYKTTGIPARGISALSWLLFGARKMMPSAELLFAALSSYEVPAVVLGMGVDRSESYVHRERKPHGALYRRELANHNARDVEKYAYVTRDYALGSMIGELTHPYAQQSWSFCYASEGDRHPVFFATHPFEGDERLQMFFPDPLRVFAANAILYDSTSLSYDKMRGASPYEILFQHRNVLMALYDIPENVANPWINGFLSKDVTVREQRDDGWMFCQMGRAFLAIKFLQAVEFQEMPAGWKIISRGRRNAVIVEAGSVEETPSFEEFKARFAETKVKSKKISETKSLTYSNAYGDVYDVSESGEKIRGVVELAYTSSSGDVFEMTSRGERKLNGYPMATARTGRWPLFDGPFIKADERKKIVLLRSGKLWRQLDFAKWEIRDVDGTFGAELTKRR